MLTFRQRVTKEVIGCPGPFNACADPVVCNGMGVYLRLHDDSVTEANWWCGQCSDAERQTLELACQLILGKEIPHVHALSVAAFAVAGGQGITDLRMTCVRVLLALEIALIDYEVKRRLAAAAGQPIDSAQLVKQLGFHGRDGRQHLKALLEDQLQRYQLRVPSVKTQEWAAFGTVEDCSRWVQSAVKTDVLTAVMQRCYPEPL